MTPFRRSIDGETKGDGLYIVPKADMPSAERILTVMDFAFIAKPIGWLLELICKIFGGNFTLSIFVFTLIINFVFLPLNLKQQKSMASQARMKNKMDKIKEKYKDDKMAQQQAMGELMQESGASPMTGCLLMFIRLPFFIAIYTAVQKPLTYILGVSGDVISKAMKTVGGKTEISILENIGKLTGAEFGEIRSAAERIDFSFLGIDLTATPNIGKPSWIWLIPVLSCLTSILSTFVTTQMQKKTNPGAAQGAGCMYIFMPAFSLFIAFGVPGAVGFYWACSNIVSMLISVLTSKISSPTRTIAQLEAKTVLNRMKYEESKIAAAKAKEEAAQ